jgi:hypothetical protein
MSFKAYDLDFTIDLHLNEDLLLDRHTHVEVAATHAGRTGERLTRGLPACLCRLARRARSSTASTRATSTATSTRWPQSPPAARVRSAIAASLSPKRAHVCARVPAGIRGWFVHAGKGYVIEPDTTPAGASFVRARVARQVSACAHACTCRAVPCADRRVGRATSMVCRTCAARMGTSTT